MTNMNNNLTLDDNLSTSQYFKHILGLNGYRFNFQSPDQQNQIRIFASGISGKEMVYVNDDLLSEKRNFKIKSTHNFSHGQDNYKIIFHVKNLFTAKVDCQLYINDQLLDQDSRALYIKNGKTAWGSMLLAFSSGLLIGGLASASIIALLELV